MKNLKNVKLVRKEVKIMTDWKNKLFYFFLNYKYSLVFWVKLESCKFPVYSLRNNSKTNETLSEAENHVGNNTANKYRIEICFTRFKYLLWK